MVVVVSHLFLVRVEEDGEVEAASSLLDPCSETRYVALKFVSHRVDLVGVAFAGLREFFSRRQQLLSVRVGVLKQAEIMNSLAIDFN